MRIKILLASFLLIFSSVSFANQIQDHLEKGNDYVKERRFEDAIKEYEGASKLDPNNAQVYLLLGLTYAQMSQLDKAVDLTKKATQKDPGYVTFYQLGLIYAAQNKTDKALDAFEKALKYSPQSYQAEYQRGLVWMSQKKYDKAIEAFKKVIFLNPYFNEAYVTLGGAHYHNGDKAAAQEQVTKLREMKQDGYADAFQKWIDKKEK